MRSKLRKSIRKFFNNAKNKDEWDSYKSKLTEYYKALKRARIEIWKRYQGLKFFLVMPNFRGHSRKKEITEAEYTDTGEQTLALLLTFNPIHGLAAKSLQVSKKIWKYYNLPINQSGQSLYLA